MATSEKKINLLDFNRQGMRDYFASIGEKPFRADQVMKWIYHFGIDNFEDMSNLNKKLKARLSAECEIRAPEISVKQPSEDGTIKYALLLDGGQEVETVWIPEKGSRNFMCIFTGRLCIGMYILLNRATGLQSQLKSI